MIEFEKLPVIKNRIANFNLKYSGELNGYVGPKQYQSHVDFIDGCWFMFQQQQSQQAKIDELNKTIVLLSAGLRKNKANKHKLLERNIELRNKIDELQARIDIYEKHVKAIKHIHETQFDEHTDTIFILGNLDGFIEYLESDLKGNKDD